MGFILEYIFLLVCKDKGKLHFFPSCFYFPHQSSHEIRLKFCYFYAEIFFICFSWDLFAVKTKKKTEANQPTN